MKTLKSILFLAVLAFISCEKNMPMEEAVLIPLTVMEDENLPAIQVNQTRLHSETFGQNKHPMIVILHDGPGGDYRSLLSCQHYANDGYFVVFYDQRGSGLSQRHPQDIYTLELFVEDLKAVVDYYKYKEDQEIILLAQGWGAVLASAYIDSYPNEISGLILLEPTEFNSETVIQNQKQWVQMEESSQAHNITHLAEMVKEDTHESLDYQAESAAFASANSQYSSELPYWRFGAICNTALLKSIKENPFDYHVAMSAYSEKVLLVYSELNKQYGPVKAAEIAAVFTDVECTEIPDCNAQIVCTAWESYQLVSMEFLSQMNSHQGK